jgi:hypothetical protein
MKRCIYHLHIPRTSGVLIRELFKKNNPKSFIVSGHKEKLYRTDMMNADFISGHYGTLPIEYASSTFAILREPIDRTFSCLKYIWSHFYFDMTVDNFFEFYLSSPELIESVSNQQSKFLTGPIDINNYNLNIQNLKKMVESNWFVQGKPELLTDVIQSISLNNIKILDYSSKNIYHEVSEIIQNNYTKENFETKINSSTKVSEKVYKKYYDKIVEINNLDLELYEYFRN